MDSMRKVIMKESISLTKRSLSNLMANYNGNYIFVTFEECTKNHGVHYGYYVSDECSKFMRSDFADAPGGLFCHACGCHRNLHRMVELPHFRYYIPPPQPPRDHVFAAAFAPPPPPQQHPQPQPHPQPAQQVANNVNELRQCQTKLFIIYSLLMATSNNYNVKYDYCMKNHGVSYGHNVYDGCGEFMPSGDVGTPDALFCHACGCHRSFHHKSNPPPPQTQIPQYDVYRGAYPIRYNNAFAAAFVPPLQPQPQPQLQPLPLPEPELEPQTPQQTVNNVNVEDIEEDGESELSFDLVEKMMGNSAINAHCWSSSNNYCKSISGPWNFDKLRWQKGR
ncbi:hypothetical protein LguiA_008523 [Lonicera macranthoides]